MRDPHLHCKQYGDGLREKYTVFHLVESVFDKKQYFRLKRKIFASQDQGGCLAVQQVWPFSESWPVLNSDVN
jgi:hypothetical protein